MYIILTIVGARPQFIKAAVVSRAIANFNNNYDQPKINEIIVHTGQHYDANMSDVFFSEMKIPHPDYNLKIGGSSHGAMTGKMLEQIEEILQIKNPDLVLVYGDTNSTLAGALAAAKLHIPVAHVEAGLRSFNMKMPEEINRILTDRISKYLFCPTEIAVNNLKNEGVELWPDVKINQVGDVMYDAALYYKAIATPSTELSYLLDEIGDNFYLCTLHRAENTDDKMKMTNIITALDMIAKDTPIILPLHPRTGKQLKVWAITPNHIKIIEPVGYFDMITLLNKCQAVFTDSGGVQKEAYYFHKPCVTLRDETEWGELVENNLNLLVGSEIERIINAEHDFVLKSRDYNLMLYGDGNAGEKIVKTIIETQ